MSDLEVDEFLIILCQIALVIAKLLNPDLASWWMILLPLEVGVGLYLLSIAVIWIVTRDMREDEVQ
ncbi:hypothetical protein BJD55_gp064 [Gordonia phage Yvonnetastic]|uniref:Uncharacterized protein n=1 Tax=Gordonia phage Yvonnetastic TaxID=1821566 RepID=A0A142K9B9_9CAUD|nr:hypothetical protein BJD55_gp064 [Gordonia phage Yvonnetastic]AMS02702.1 hypothetical protein SEA_YVONNETASTIC_158 [Gordonia phage Yvonnetastic]